MKQIFIRGEKVGRPIPDKIAVSTARFINMVNIATKKIKQRGWAYTRDKKE